jgi:hypothetical protein
LKKELFPFELEDNYVLFFEKYKIWEEKFSDKLNYNIYQAD